MPSVSDILERFRPSGTPGAASLTGVPADRMGERREELGPLLDRLSDVQVEAARIRREAELEGLRRRKASAEEAAALVAGARGAADLQRRSAVARAQSTAQRQARDRLDEADREAASLVESAGARAPDFVDQVLGQARDVVEQLLGGSP